MQRQIAQLINSIGYRRRLAETLPDMEARLLTVLDEGDELRTRKWIVRRQGPTLEVVPNDLAEQYRCLPLPLPNSPREELGPKGI